jgi:S-ribosylhomocysteine lyase LuxS involved in autoinducer biosynthesis
MKASFSTPRGSGRVGMWRERTSSMWDALTLELLDWEVPATIYAEEKKKNSRDVEAFHLNKLIGNPGAMEGPGIHTAEHSICSRRR